MTLLELQAKRTEILKSLGIAASSYGQMSIQYTNQEKALAIIDAQIEKLSTTPTASIGRLYSREGL